jgi:hypothetical protein
MSAPQIGLDPKQHRIAAILYNAAKVHTFLTQTAWG